MSVEFHPTVAKLRGAFPDVFRDGARCGFFQKYEGQREPGGYPVGFHSWPLDRKNAWFAGFNRGRCDRIRLASEMEAA